MIDKPAHLTGPRADNVQLRVGVVQRDDVHTGEKELDVHVGRQLVLPVKKRNVVALKGVRFALVWPSPIESGCRCGVFEQVLDSLEEGA